MKDLVRSGAGEVIDDPRPEGFNWILEKLQVHDHMDHYVPGTV
jgi:hypothetical protein